MECTVNRVHDRYFDQLRRTGHHDRIEDLDLLHALGVRTLRYPILWERTERDGWAWPDARIARLRELQITPIVGLVHHGSGPPATSLVDPAFPDRLAAYAGQVARRYPDVTAYTPINEPLTTARFAGLYGHWYPHGRDSATFVRCLLTEIRATAAAMRAIRRVTPAAQLVVTEDLGYTHASAPLAYQATYENHRRWLSLDLLEGRVGRSHPLRPWLMEAGASARELDELVDTPCPPDLIGLNYYVTSERYLDDNLAAWPASTHGGNGHQRYADVEAVRACGLAGIEALLGAVWKRYARPIAITEVHLGCTREEQLRWLLEIHDAAMVARRRGVLVRAITAWSAFGAYDWSSLVTRDDGQYEPGLFDVRGPAPRPTALAAAIRELANGRRPDHPALYGEPWWRRATPRRAKVA
jgi:dTDP-4-dehydrorhamnose reductase